MTLTKISDSVLYKLKRKQYLNRRGATVISGQTESDTSDNFHQHYRTTVAVSEELKQDKVQVSRQVDSDGESVMPGAVADRWENAALCHRDDSGCLHAR